MPTKPKWEFEIGQRMWAVNCHAVSVQELTITSREESETAAGVHYHYWAGATYVLADDVYTNPLDACRALWPEICGGLHEEEKT